MPLETCARAATITSGANMVRPSRWLSTSRLVRSWYFFGGGRPSRGPAIAGTPCAVTPAVAWISTSTISKAVASASIVSSVVMVAPPRGPVRPSGRRSAAGSSGARSGGARAPYDRLGQQDRGDERHQRASDQVPGRRQRVLGHLAQPGDDERRGAAENGDGGGVDGGGAEPAHLAAQRLGERH